VTVERFLLTDDTAAHRLFTYLKAERRRAAAAGQPLMITVAHYRMPRTDVQNREMWAILEQIAEQVTTTDGHHSRETWNRYAKEHLLPETNSRGLEKWRSLPNGERELVMSTSDLDEAEMHLYLQQLKAYAQAELGVELSAQRQQSA